MTIIHANLNMGRLKPEGIARYRKEHDEIDLDFVRALRNAGTSTISCFLQGVDLAVYSESRDGFEKGKAELAQNQAGAEFGKRMLPLVAEGAKSIFFKEVFNMPPLNDGVQIQLEKRLVSRICLRPDAITEFLHDQGTMSPELLAIYGGAGVISMRYFLHETTVLIYVVRDEAVYGTRGEAMENHPLVVQYKAKMQGLTDPAGPHGAFEEVFRLPDA